MMVTRISDMPVYAVQTDQIEASLFNLWRRARLHLNMPLRIELPGMKQMVLIVEDDSWVVVDQCQYDLPVLACRLYHELLSLPGQPSAEESAGSYARSTGSQVK